MAQLPYTLDVRDTFVMRVKFAKAFKLRVWLACQMLRLVALVCPLDVAVVEREGVGG